MIWPMMKTHVPGRSTVVSLGSIVPALTVTAHDEDLVLGVLASLAVEIVDVLFEPLPLGSIALGPLSPNLFGIRGIRSVHEAKVPVRLRVLALVEVAGGK
jgi:hypothetical protein